MIRKIDNIILLGTSHVAKQSVKEIKEIIELYNPSVVGIELDLNRLKSLLSEKKELKKKKNNKKNKKVKSIKKRTIKEVGMSGYLFAIVAGYVQQKIGKSLGIEAGADMKEAYLVARDKKIPTALIDIDIKVTLRKLSRLGFFKKVNMFSSLFFKSFKKEYRNKLNFDIKSGVPDEKFIKTALGIFKKEVPLLYNILLEDRNVYMSNRLLDLRDKNEGYILAVVGAGHLEGMENYLVKKLKEKDLLNNNGFNFSFSVNIDSNE